MSLNGLDEPAVQEAYQQASHEAGGWFLLHYVSRDSVELLARGKGGVVEARLAIAKYSETSPLYGLIFYRRRKFLIKHIPEGTSRLLQARTAVHLQDVLERYSPYETLLEISTPDGLNDTSLAASFPLHTAASPSISSSRLDEISEDAEDGPSPRRPSIPASTTSTVYPLQRTSSDGRNEANVSMTSNAPSISNASTPASYRAPFPRSSARMSSINPRHSIVSPSKGSASRLAAQPDFDQRSITSAPSTTKSPESEYANSERSHRGRDKNEESLPTLPPSTEAGNDGHEHVLRPWTSQELPETLDRPGERHISDTPRASASTERTSAETSTTDGRKYVDDPYDFSKYDFAPKVKLGPRPVASDERIKRPTVASIASLPATYRPSVRRPESSRPKSQITQSGISNYPPPIVTALPVPPIPTVPEYNPRPVSRGSIKSIQSQKSPMTAERLRLMKAVELRKRQLRRSTPRLVAITPPEEPEAAASDVPETPVLSTEIVERLNQVADTLPPTIEAIQPPGQKVDSGIELTQGRSDVPELLSKMSRTKYKDADHDGPENGPVLEAVSSISNDLNNRPELDNLNAKSELADAAPFSAVSAQSFPTMSSESLITTSMSKTDAAKVDNPVTSPLRENSTITPAPSAQQALQNGLPTRSVAGLGIQAADARQTLVPRIVMPDGGRPISVISAVTPTYDKDVHSASAISPISDIDESPLSPRMHNGDLARRRRGLVQPLTIGEHNPDSDDELLDELQTATFGEAKPVAVPKSPMGQNFVARRPSGSSLHSLGSVKSVTIPSKIAPPSMSRSNDYSPRLSPDPELTPTMTPTFDSSDTTPGKRNVSAGIFQRIQTLNEASGRDAPGFPSSQTPASRPLTPDLQDRQRLTKGVSVRSQTNTYQKQIGRQTTAPPANTKARSPTATASGLRGQQRSPVPPESVTVTARIVRSHTAPGGDEMGGKLHHSDLVMNYKRASSQHEQHVPEINTTHHAEQSQNSVPQSAQSSHSSGRKSWARLPPSLSPSAEDFPSPPNRPTLHAPGSRTSFMLWDDEPAAVPKEGSRTSRFLKRMSTLGASNKRRSVMQTSPVNDAAPSTANPSVSPGETPPAIVVGDLNIQFPDTLLWKRRIVEIDSKGYVTFAIPLAMDIHKNSAKKYHLTDFEMPYTPDVDRQELPHSIMLDSLDGNTTLQAACEDSLAHRQVLHTLRSHWKAWNAVGR